MKKISITDNKIWINIFDRENNFSGKISKRSLDNFIRFLQDDLHDKLPFEWGAHDNRSTYLWSYCRRYNIKGYGSTIRRDRIPVILLAINLYRGGSLSIKEMATMFGYKKPCKSVDRIINGLSLSTITMMYNQLRKEKTYGKTSSSNKTRVININS